MMMPMELGPTRFKCTGEPTHCSDCARDALTDDQLHAEWLKRHPNQVLTAFGGVSDDQLRAECERRFGPDYTNGLPRVREANLIDERDAVIAERDGAHRAVLALTRERDEWRLRAEAAEEHLADARDGEISDDVVRAEYTRRFMVTAPAPSPADWLANGPGTLLANGPGTLYGFPKAPETGPGIAATKPDTARWGPSDEDLLADDAEPKR